MKYVAKLLDVNKFSETVGKYQITLLWSSVNTKHHQIFLT